MELQKKGRRFVSYILAIIVILAGMYFEEIEVDSFFACAPVETSAAYISSCDAAITNANACTAEMLGGSNNSYLRQLAGRYMNGRKDVRVISGFLSASCCSQSLSNHFTTAKVLQIPKRDSKAVVLNYIHSIDGKKWN